MNTSIKKKGAKKVCTDVINDTNKTTDICPICYDNLNTEQSYTIPDCNHTFHTNCLIHWFRNGYRHCPTCNHLGLGSTKYCTSSSSSYSKSIENTRERFNLIKSIVLESGKPIWVIDKIKSHTEKTKDMRILRNDLTALKISSGVYKEIEIKIKNTNTKISKIQWDIKKIEKSVISYPLYPVIIVNRKNPRKKRTYKKIKK